MTTALKDFGWGALPSRPLRLMSALIDTVYHGTTGAGDGQLSLPYDISFNNDGARLAVADMGNNRIQIFSVSRNAIAHIVSYGTYGSGNGQFIDPSSVSFSADGTRLAVADIGNSRIQVLGISGSTVTHQASYGSLGAGNGQFEDLYGVSFNSNGSRLAVADTGNNRIQILGISGNTITHQVSYGTFGSANGQFSNPFRVVFSHNNTRLAVSDVNNNRIQLFGISGNTITHQVSYGVTGSGSGQFTYPYSVSFNQDSTRISVADLGNSRIQVLGVNGTAITPQMIYGSSGSGHGQFVYPMSATFSRNGERLAITDAGINRIQLL